MVSFPYDISQRNTINVPPPRAFQAITQPSHRRNFAEIAQDMRAHGERAYDVLDEAIERCRDRGVRAMLQAVMVQVLQLKLDSTDLQQTLSLTQRSASPTVPLEQPQQPGRMSLPNLPPPPHVVRPHAAWWELI